MGSTSGRHLVFVYGTLKRGERNHYWLRSFQLLDYFEKMQPSEFHLQLSGEWVARVSYCGVELSSSVTIIELSATIIELSVGIIELSATIISKVFC